jgi:type III restriction enzyme
VPPSFAADEPRQRRQRIVFTLSATRTVQHVPEVLPLRNAERLEPVSMRSVRRSMGDMRTWHTARPCQQTKRSRINFCVYDSRWEARPAYETDWRPHVSVFVILYLWKGVVVRMTGGTNLVLEVKGRDAEREPRLARCRWAT